MLNLEKIHEAKQRDQKQHACELRVEKKLGRRVALIFMTPNCDDEIHRNEHYFPEKEEQK